MNKLKHVLIVLILLASNVYAARNNAPVRNRFGQELKRSCIDFCSFSTCINNGCDKVCKQKKDSDGSSYVVIGCKKCPHLTPSIVCDCAPPNAGKKSQKAHY